MSNRLQRVLAILRREEGSNLVEMAVSATVLFAMLFGICQMSIALYVYHYTSDAARQASRYAMVRGNTSCTNTPHLTNCGTTAAQIQTYVQSLNYPGIKTSSVTATTTWCAATITTTTTSKTTTWAACSADTSSAPGNLVKVSVSYPLSFTIPFSKSLSFTMGASSQMVISQ